MPATRDTLVTRWVKFAGNPTEQVEAMIAVAGAFIIESQFASTVRYDMAVEALAAHFLMMERLATDGAAGPVTSRSKTESTVGKTESTTVSFGGASVASTSDASLQQTMYGRIYIFLRDSELEQVAILAP